MGEGISVGSVIEYCRIPIYIYTMGPGKGMATVWLCLLLLSSMLNFGVANSECQNFKDVRITLVNLQPHSLPLIENSPGFKPGAVILCERICISGLPRFQNLKKYAHSFRVKVQSSEPTSKLFQQKIEVCLHRNVSLGLGQCPQDWWKTLDKGLWTGTMSPYETKFIDIRMPHTFSDSLAISVEEEFRPYRLVFLGLGLVMLNLAPIVSKWVPFYYSSAMAFGIILVILIILFQAMKLLPTGRKSTLYIVLYGATVGLGSVILRYFSGLVHSMLQELGFGEEMFNPVAALLLVCVILTGAWLGYWGVRKFVLSEDGIIDIGTAQFVTWAIRIVASVMILQSSHDSLLAVLVLTVGVIFTSFLRHMQPIFSYSNLFLRTKQHTFRRKVKRHSRAEFLSKFPKEDVELLKSQATAFKWSPHSPHVPGSSFSEPRSTPSPSSRMVGPSFTAPKNTLSPSSRMAGPASATNKNPPSPGSRVHGQSSVTPKTPSPQIDEQDYYSTFHKTPERKRFSKEEWETFTRDSTKKALRKLVSTPEFAEWAVDNADRIMTMPSEKREETLYIENESKIGIKQEHGSDGGGWFGW